MSALLSLGIAGALDHDVVRSLAPRLEAAGFHALWVNDTPAGDALAALRAAADVTSRLVLAAGVVPVDRRPAAALLRDLARAGLPEERLVLGIGAGGLRTGAVARVRDAVRELREGSAARLVAGALGPRMRELAFRETDGALLSWLTPGEAAAARATGRAQGSGSAILYVRTIVEPDARGRLEREARAYAGYPAYAAQFARLGVDPLDTTIDLDAHPDRLDALGDAVDEVVLRAITPDDRLDEYLRFLEHPAVRAVLR